MLAMFFLVSFDEIESVSDQASRLELEAAMEDVALVQSAMLAFLAAVVPKRGICLDGLDVALRRYDLELVAAGADMATDSPGEDDSPAEQPMATLHQHEAL